MVATCPCEPQKSGLGMADVPEVSGTYNFKIKVQWRKKKTIIMKF